MNIQEYIASGIVESYVMGLCTQDEKLELEDLRSQYPELNQEITRFETLLEEQLLKETVLPAEETDADILRKLGTSLAPVVELNPVSEKRRLRRFSYMAAAAILLLLVSAYFIYTLSLKTSNLEKELSELKTSQTLPASDFEIMRNPKITPVAMYGVGVHGICRCTMFWDKETGKLYIMIHHLPPSTGTNKYKLWAIVDDQPVDAGVINDELRDRFIEMNSIPGKARSFMVTLEEAGSNGGPGENIYLKGSI